MNVLTSIKHIWDRLGEPDVLYTEDENLAIENASDLSNADKQLLLDTQKNVDQLMAKHYQAQYATPSFKTKLGASEKHVKNKEKTKKKEIEQPEKENDLEL